uniref:RING-type domain-containing protein n=1 Tax=Ditylenchus dipsaci TaxID=166011 RepID=A0A915E774_9BILA
MKSSIDIFLDDCQSTSLLKQIGNKIEIESKCQICWELSIRPIICWICGNNVGCSKCVNKLFDTLNHTAKCPLCSAEWRRDPQDTDNTSLWTGHCLNRALAEILNQINEPTCSSLPESKPNNQPVAENVPTYQPVPASDTIVLPMNLPTSPPKKKKDKVH